MEKLSIWEQIAVMASILVIALLLLCGIYSIYLKLNKWH